MGGTPFLPSIVAARKYFEGNKNEWVYTRKGDGTIDEDANPVGTESGDPYTPLTCQQRFLIDVTDGRGGNPEHDTWYDYNTEFDDGDTLNERTRQATALLADAGVTPIGVGFGLQEDDAGQLYELSREANLKGNASDTDAIYGLYEEDSSGGVPFFAFNKMELLNSLKSIAESVKGAIFHGSAPAAATSTDLGDVVIVAKFDGARWTGDVEAIGKSGGVWQDSKWKASDELPSTRDVFTIDPADPLAKTVVEYTDSTLAGDNWLCKSIGDIVNSTPLVVGRPPYYYPFDDYRSFIWERNFDDPRDSVIYIGANDGSLHAIDLVSGREKWAFVPKSMHAKLNMADIAEAYDMCATGYCHKYFVAGSPQADDIYADFGSGDEWRTILVTGLREGGETYFALDVTTGESFDESGPQHRIKFLWEFTDDELGETWNDAAIDRVAVASSTDKSWGVFFGSGYSKSDQPNKTAYLYGIQAHDAGDLWKDAAGSTTNRIQIASGSGSLNYDTWASSFALPDQTGETVTGASSGATGTIVDVHIIGLYSHGTIDLKNVTGTFIDNEVITSSGGGEAAANGTLSGLSNDALSSPLTVDIEDDFVADRIYTGNLYGDMFRVTSIGKGQVPVVDKLFTFEHAAPNINPIRAKADMAYTKVDGEIWVYFGTGIYEQQVDKTNNITQYFFGLQDNTIGKTHVMADLAKLKADFTTTQVGGEDVVVRTVSGSNPGLISWAMELGPGASGSERMIVKPLVIGGIVFFTTFVPDADVCEGAGDTWVFALDYQSGLAPMYPIFDLNGDGMFDDDDKIDTDSDGIKETVPIGVHVGRCKGSHPVLHKDTLFITTTGSGADDVVGGGGGGGGLQTRKVNLLETKIRVKAWKQR